MVTMRNVLIIGGGISAHTAAIYTARAALQPLILSGDNPDQLSLTTIVENFPGFPEGINGPDLVENSKKQAQRFGAEYKNAQVSSVTKIAGGFEVVTSENEKFQSRTLIICSGASARLTGIPGEKQFFGRGVSTCAVCLPPDESIIANSSIKEIKDVTITTRVLTHDGTYQHVAGFNRTPFKGKLVSIKPRFFTEPVRLTPNHPVYTTRPIRKGPNETLVGFDEFSWKEAGSLSADDCVIYPIVRENQDISSIKISDYVDVKVREGIAYPVIETHTANGIPNEISVDADFCRLMGYYIAEGSAHKHMLSIHFRKDEKEYIDDVIRILKAKTGLEPAVEYPKNVCRITVYSRLLVDLFKHLFGAYSHQKHLPHWAIVMPIEKQKEFVKGAWRGDGCVREEDFCYVTSSRELAYQLRDILLRFGILPGMQKRDKDKINKWVNKIEGRLVGFNYNKYHLVVGGQSLEKMSEVMGIEHPRLKTRQKISRQAWLTDTHAILPIREISYEDYDGIVLNMGIENNNTYIAKNFIVHNCDAALYRNKNTVVIGGGDSAMEESMALYKFAKKVTIVHRRGEFKASQIMQDRVLKLTDKVSVLWNSAPVEVTGEKFVKGLKIKDVTTGKESLIPTDGVFLAIGHIPNTGFVKGLVELTEEGFIKGTGVRTSVPGIFAAGDVMDPRYKQAITSAGTGCQAALEAEWFLEKLQAEGKY
jgi:thioredoxin reductase